MAYLELKKARTIVIDPEPGERGQLLVYATIDGGRHIALTMNAN